MLSGNPITIEANTIDLNRLHQYENVWKASIYSKAGFVHVDQMLELIAKRAKSFGD